MIHQVLAVNRWNTRYKTSLKFSLSSFFSLIIVVLFYFSRVEVLKIIFFRHHPLLYESFIYINNMDTALEIKMKNNISIYFIIYSRRDLHKISTTQIIKRHILYSSLYIELYLTRDRTIYHNSLYNIIANNT